MIFQMVTPHRWTCIGTCSMEHAILKIRQLLESDDSVRRTERAYAASQTQDNLLKVLRAYKQAGKTVRTGRGNYAWPIDPKTGCRHGSDHTCRSNSCYAYTQTSAGMCYLHWTTPSSNHSSCDGWIWGCHDTPCLCPHHRHY